MLFHHRMHRPAFLLEVICIAGTVISRVTCQIRIIVQCSLIDRQEFMSLNVSVV